MKEECICGMKRYGYTDGFHEVFLCYNCGSFIGSVGGDQLFGMLIKSNPEVVLKLIQAKMLIPIRDFYA
tara:strand:- start:1124 stop:1330 length:207 start_codon:yes stop_codon:yes gene_type:complete